MPDKELTVQRSLADFKKAYVAKRKLIEREREDFLFALGEQWDPKDVQNLKDAGFKAVTDNRISPNIFLLTGLERQNRSEFKAFPEGEEDTIKAEIASALFKNAIKQSDFSYKSSEQFKDGITCGESHLELYLDNTYNLLNAKPCWKKVDGDCLFPEPGFREYDFSDARYVYKLTKELSEGDLISLYPEKRTQIEAAKGGKVDVSGVVGDNERHNQPRDYPKTGGDSGTPEPEEKCFDLIERYYKKYVEVIFVGDKQTGEVRESESADKANQFIADYQNSIVQEQQQYQQAVMQAQMQAQVMSPEGMPTQEGVMPPSPPQLPPEPSPKDPNRFQVIPRMVPEIWVYAHVPGIDEPMADERAWFYPKWKAYPFIPYFARFSTAPLTGDDKHLLIQGLVHGVKGVQEIHNKTQMLMIRHLNSSANSGWLAEEDSWVDRDKVKELGAAPGVNLEYRKGSQKPERIFPTPLSQGHAQMTEASSEAIKSQLGINSDLLAAQQGGADSGRAIALRQRQGLLMVQELFDNLSRSRMYAGKLLLSQMQKMYDTETAKKILGDAFLKKNFPAPMMKEIDPVSGMPVDVPMKDEMGQPMPYDDQMAELAIAEVLSGDLGQYDVTVGEAVASETMVMANLAELKEFAASFPGLVPPDVMIEAGQLPQATKGRILNVIKQAQNAQMGGIMPPPTAAKGEPNA